MQRIVLAASLLLLIAILPSFSQSREGCVAGAIWLPADKGLTGSPIPGNPWGISSSAVVHRRQLYLLHTAGPEAPGRYIISTWDGVAWHDSLTLMPDGGSIEGIASIGDGLHVYGGFAGINGSAAPRMARWNGTAWESTGLTADGVVTEAAEFRGEPYVVMVTGRLPDIGYHRDVTIMMRRHAGAWSPLGDFRSIDARDTGDHLPNPGLIDLMIAGDDALYIGGSFDSVAGSPMANITKWDGSAFRPIGGGSATEVSSMALLGDELYAGGSFDGMGATMARWDGEHWHALKGFPDYFSILGSHGGMLYSIHIEGGDAPEPYSILRWNDRGREMVSGLAGRPFRFIEYGGELYAYGDIASSCGTPIKGVARLCDGICGTGAGMVYRDDDGNCIDAPTEPRLPGILMELAPGDHMSITDADGTFREPLGPGTYTVRPIPPRYWSFCTTSRTATMAAPDSRVEGLAFGAKIAETKQDVAVSLACGPARAGGPIRYTIRYSGIGAIPSSGSVRLKLDTAATFRGSTPSPTRAGGGVIEWEFQDLAMFASRDIQVVADVAPAIPDATPIGAAADIFVTTLLDAFAADNHDSTSALVGDPHTPYSITATPGHDDDMIYYLDPSDTTLAYTVRFRNTGADTVRTVTIADALSEYHDLTSFLPGAASHRYAASFVGPGWLRILLQDIDLAPGEEGYVKFSLRVRKGLAPGTLIPNSALVTLDYGTDVTNTVTSRLLLNQSSVPAAAAPRLTSIAPNPARGRARVALGGKGGTVELHTLLGERLRRITTESEEVDLDLTGLAPGLYLVRVTTPDGIAEEPLMVR